MDREIASPSFPTDVGEAQEVERLRRAVAPLHTALFGVPTEFDQPRFLRVQFQAKLGKPVSERVSTSSGIGFLAETDDKVVGVADDGGLAVGLALPPIMNPEVQHIVQEHVRIEVAGLLERRLRFGLRRI